MSGFFFFLPLIFIEKVILNIRFLKYQYVSFYEQQKLTNSHPHRETDPRVSTQLKHQVNVDKYAHNGQKRQERNL